MFATKKMHNPISHKERDAYCTVYCKEKIRTDVTPPCTYTLHTNVQGAPTNFIAYKIQCAPQLTTLVKLFKIVQ